MIWLNYDDVMSQLQGAGLVIDKQLGFDARIQRWKVLNEDNERRGWTRLREWTSTAGNTYIVGSYGIWHGTDDGYTKIAMPESKDGPKLTVEDKAAIRVTQKEAAARLKKERDAEAKVAASWAANVWSKCAPCAEHEYLTRKQIQPHGVRVMGDRAGITIEGLDDSNHYRLGQAAGALVVPMHDEHGNVCGIQFVYPAGHPRRVKIERDKEFWPSGMAMGGTFGIIGPIRRNGVLLVCEGYATAATLFEATGQSVAYAFSANNLAKAGKILRKKYPQLKLLFCADDDYFTAGNPGVTAASNAMAEIEKSAWIKPDFTGQDGNDLRNGKKLTDFNDLYVLTGHHLTLADQVNAKLDELKWRDATPAGGAAQQGGGGNGRRSAVAVMSLDESIARFVPLDDGTGKYLFDTWTNKVAHKDQMIALLPAGVRWDDVKRHPDWVGRGAFYLDQVGFDPSGNDDGVKLNTWRGWPRKPSNAGSCERMLETLSYLTSGESNGREVFMWLLRWMAYPLQNPGAKMSSAVIMHGPQGTGKSAVFQSLAKIYGDYATILNQRGLEDKFNADWADSKLFILAEEVVTRAEMWHIKNELKELVTGEWIRVNPKNVAAYRQRNQVNIVYLSNENQPLPIENDDRRHLVVWTPPMLSEAWYDELWTEIDNGGIEAFYHFLLHLDLADFHPKKRPPMTVAKQELINLSLPSDSRFVNDWIGGETRWPVVPCLSADLYAAYLKWCRENGETRPRPSNQFLGMVARMPGWQSRLQRVYGTLHFTGTSTPKRVVIPPEEVLQRSGRAQPADKQTAHWVTEGIIEFQNAASDGEQWGAAA